MSDRCSSQICCKLGEQHGFCFWKDRRNNAIGLSWSIRVQSSHSCKNVLPMPQRTSPGFEHVYIITTPSQKECFQRSNLSTNGLHIENGNSRTDIPGRCALIEALPGHRQRRPLSCCQHRKMFPDPRPSFTIKIAGFFSRRFSERMGKTLFDLKFPQRRPSEDRADRRSCSSQLRNSRLELAATRASAVQPT